MDEIINNTKHLTLEEEVEIMMRFTETYKAHYTEHPAIREAMCLAQQFPAILCRIEKGDLYAGRMEYLSLGFSPQPDAFGYCYYCDQRRMSSLMNLPNIHENTKQNLEKLLQYWSKESTTSKLKAAYPEMIRQLLPSDEWTQDSGIAFPLYRMAGSELDFEKLLTLGIPGMLELVESRQGKLFQGMKIALNVLKDVFNHYKRQALDMDLYQIADVLERISNNKPDSLQEAIQLMYLYWLISGSLNFGRMDTYLADFYVQELERGTLTEAQALCLLEGLWRLIASRHRVTDARVMIGGRGRKNEKNADRFALLAMEATRNVKEVTPQLSMRFYKGMNTVLMEKALEIIGEGRTFPMLYNDDVNIPAVMKAYDIHYEEAIDYCPYGCGEYILFHKSFGTPSGVINLLKALEVTLHNGIDPVTGQRAGLALGELEDFATFEDLFQAYSLQVEKHVEALAVQEEMEYNMAGKESACLYLSMLYDDCIEKGKGIFEGGIRYLGGTLETYGNTNTVDSLFAIKSLVYDKKLLTKKQLLKALNADFVDFGRERELLLQTSKYGNDMDDVDEMAVKVHEHICNVTRKQRENTELHSYLVVIINNSANTILGRKTGASADGRKAFTYMANANNPVGGMDQQGVTAMLNSLVKLDTSIHAGAVQNIKFSKALFKNNADIIEVLLDTYFQCGGAQAMISVLDKTDLENAIKEPEKYRNLIVRVGGFSARFVELEKDVQQEILSRTLY